MKVEYSLLYIPGLYRCTLKLENGNTCKSTAQTLTNAEKHVKEFHGPDLFSWVCGTCPLKDHHYFKNERGLKSHLKTKHPGDTNYRELLHNKLGCHWEEFSLVQHLKKDEEAEDGV
jgi:hypothetical protein